jgi:integrase/recombinase XerC
VKTAIEQFERYLRRRYGDRSTPKHYLSDMRIFVQHIGNKAPTEVSVQDIDHFVDRQVGQGLRPTTINRRLATLRTFFEFLASEEPDRWWPNPVVWRRHGLKQGETLPRDVTDATVSTLFAAIDDDRDRALFGLMIGAGLRVGEVADLRLTDLEAPRPPDQMARLRVWGKGRKERIVWLTPPLYATVEAWLHVRPQSESEHLFLNQHRRPLSVAGIQYLLKRHAKKAEVQVTCHQLRHTFARRLAEQEMPIESLSKLLGHAQVTTTQVYTAGADPQLRESFAQAMAELEASPETAGLFAGDVVSVPQARPPAERADPADLDACLARFDPLPDWLKTPLRAYLTWRWRNWQPHMARQHGHRLARQLHRIWEVLVTQHALSAFSDLQRSHIEAWLNARQDVGIAASSRSNELSDLLSCLHFVADRDISLSPNLFRVAYPERSEALPRYLSESEYRRLEQMVLTQTDRDTPVAARDRAWFFTLAHTGLRVSELLNLRLSDVQLASGRLIVRGGKNTRDRLVYLTPTLSQALHTYLAHREAVDDDHLWLDGGCPLKDHQVRYRLRRWGQLCDVAATPHRLRHTLATRLVNQEMSLESLRKLLGHKDLRMTQHYARIYDATVRQQFQAAIFQAAMANIEGVVVSTLSQSETVVADPFAVYTKVDSV